MSYVEQTVTSDVSVITLCPLVGAVILNIAGDQDEVLQERIESVFLADSQS
jgi:hypothetical protein